MAKEVTVKVKEGHTVKHGVDASHNTYRAGATLTIAEEEARQLHEAGVVLLPKGHKWSDGEVAEDVEDESTEVEEPKKG